jgi:hypothetical protein
MRNALPIVRRTGATQAYGLIEANKGQVVERYASHGGHSMNDVKPPSRRRSIRQAFIAVRA